MTKARNDCRSAVILVAAALIVVSTVTGCGSLQISGRPSKQSKALRVGVTPNYPPIIYRQDGKIAGLEAELAWSLAQHMGRRLQFVAVKWEQQIPALLSGKIDIIMSGMTITPAREVRIKFSEPYLQTGLMAAVRPGHEDRYPDRQAITQTYANIGAMEGTTATSFIRRQCPNAKASYVSDLTEAYLALDGRRIDLFIHDAPAVAWLVSKYESTVKPLWIPLTEDHLAWGIRGGNKKLIIEANDALAKWKQDGTLEIIIDRWLPYRPDVRQAYPEALVIPDA